MSLKSVLTGLGPRLITAGLKPGAANTYAGVDVLSAVQAWWQANSSVQVLATDKHLWHKAAPENAELPYCTFFLVSEVAEQWTTSYPFNRSEVQINCHASTDLEARTMAVAIRKALGKTTSQPSGAALVIDGQRACHVIAVASGLEIGQGLGPGGQDCWIAYEVFDIPWTT